MAPKKQPWFRFYVEAVRDRKLRRLPPAQRWLWVTVLALARQSPEPGRLLLAAGDEPVGVDDLVDEAAVRAADVRAGMAAFERARMVERDDAGVWVVVNWSERQFESDNTTARTAKHRSKERGRNVPSTPIERRSSRARATETETETEEAEDGASGAGGGLFGFPTRAAEGLSYTQTVAKHCSEAGEPITKQETRSEDYRRVVEVVGEKLDGYPGRARLQAQVIRDYCAELGHVMDGSEAGHLLRLVGERGALACLRDVVEAMSRGAGLDPEWADKSRRVTRFAAAVGRNGKAAS